MPSAQSTDLVKRKKEESFCPCLGQGEEKKKGVKGGKEKRKKRRPLLRLKEEDTTRGERTAANRDCPRGRLECWIINRSVSYLGKKSCHAGEAKASSARYESIKRGARSHVLAADASVDCWGEGRCRPSGVFCHREKKGKPQ